MRLKAALCLALFVMAGTAQAASSLPAVYQPNAILVKLAPETAVGRMIKADGTVSTGLPEIDRLNESYRCVKFEPAFPFTQKPPYGRDLVGLSDCYYVEFVSAADIASALREYESTNAVLEAQPIGYYPIDQVFPNDPYFEDQWALYQSGNEYHIHAPTGWEFETGDTVAIYGAMDTGVLWRHPDLRNAIWVNPGEDLDGDGIVWDPDDLNGEDNDGNNLVDDLIGWDFVNAGSNPASGEDYATPDNDPKDFNGHGTHTAGIAAAISNNGVGVAGIAGGNHRFGARIMCLRMGWSSADGRGYISVWNAAQAFAYAVEKGVHVVNCSWGNHDDGFFGPAITNALLNGVLITNSAGNDNLTTGDYLAYVDGVITVAATKSNDRKASYSNYGSWVEVSAPGGDAGNLVLSTYSNEYTPTYLDLMGASMAAPMVAGLALLLKSHHPEYDRGEIYPLIVDHTDDIDGLNPGYEGMLGTGRINCYNSLSGLTSADFVVDTSWGYPPLPVSFTDASLNVTGGWKYLFGDGDSAAGPNAAHTYLLPGLHDVFYRADGPSGWHTRRKYDCVLVLKDTLRFLNTGILKGSPGAGMPVYLTNSLPVDTIIITLIKQPWFPTGNIIYDSLTFGPRTSYFERKEVVSQWSAGGQLAFRLSANIGGGSPPLQAGSGIVAYVWFHARSTSTLCYQEVCDSGQVNTYNELLKTDYVDFKPKFKSAVLTVVGGQCGDANGDGAINPTDVVGFVNCVYKSLCDCLPLLNGDVDCNGAIDPMDVVHVVNRVYKDIPLECPCP